MENIVEALLIIAASDETIAAIKAANTNPFIPDGTNRFRSHGYASSGFAISAFRKNAAIPGITTRTGIRSLR